MNVLRKTKISIESKGKTLKSLFPKGKKLEAVRDVNIDQNCQEGNLETVSRDEAEENKPLKTHVSRQEERADNKDIVPNANEVLSRFEADKSTSSAEVINDLNEMLRNRDLENDRYKQQIKELKEMVSRLTYQTEELKTENEMLRKKRIEEHQYRKKKEAGCHDRNIPDENCEVTASTWYPLEDRIEQSKKEKHEMANVLNDANETIRRREEAIRSCESEIQDLKRQIQIQQTEKTRPDPHTTQKLQEQVDALTLRLSELASARLLQNNPNIADLSDTDRPTKLAERFSELYDNEWTDAVDELCELRGIDETAGVHAMLDLLKKANTACLKYSKNTKDFLDNLTTVNIITNKPYPDDGKTGISGDDQQLNRNTHAEKVLNTVQIECCEEDYKTAQDLKRKYAKRLEGEKELSKVIGGQICIENGINPDASKCVFEYIRSCAKICWYIQIPEPPVHIGFQEEGENGHLNLDVFRYYTKSGDKLDFVVWPPLYLYKGGPLLCKGVAQGKR